MNKSFLTTKATPVITITLCYILYLSGYYQMAIAAILIFIASAIEYKKDFFKSLGFQRKRLNVKNSLIITPLFGAAFFLFYYYVMLPIVTHLTGQPIDFSAFASFKGNLPAVIGLFFYIWISAAFGEEIVFRGYLMRQFTKFFGASKLSLVMNVLLLGILFGAMHAYQGITGQIMSGITGMIMAVIFHIRKHDLWFNILIHGFFDTTALVFMYYGWS